MMLLLGNLSRYLKSEEGAESGGEKTPSAFGETTCHQVETMTVSGEIVGPRICLGDWERPPDFSSHKLSG